jgi:hypothetical protein
MHLTTEQTRKDIFPLLFLAAGLANMGVLIFSAGFTNEILSAAFPEAFSRIGLFTIVLWGLAYIAVARRYAEVPWLVAVFAVEKYFYVATWVYWLSAHGATLGDLYAQSFLAGLFFSVYGLNDLLFGVVFTAAFLRVRKDAPRS